MTDDSVKRTERKRVAPDKRELQRDARAARGWEELAQWVEKRCADSDSASENFEFKRKAQNEFNVVRCKPSPLTIEVTFDPRANLISYRPISNTAWLKVVDEFLKGNFSLQVDGENFCFIHRGERISVELAGERIVSLGATNA